VHPLFIRNIEVRKVFTMDYSRLNKFFLNESDDAERVIIIDWLLNPENDNIIKGWMRANWELIRSLDLKNHPDSPNEDALWKKIQLKIHENELQNADENSKTQKMEENLQTIKAINNKRIIGIAAAILGVVIGIGSLFIYRSLKETALNNIQNENKNLTNDVAPPSNRKAILTLADGSKVGLDNAGTGVLVTQGNVKVVKNQKGEIAYSGNNTDKVSINTLSVPKGSKPVKLTLVDGSTVWINTSSSISYPTSFIGKERRVKLQGEAYFEVAKNAAMPFFVEHNDFAIKVLGTHFNVNAYNDEKQSSVTLLEGSVAISTKRKNELLKPGQQAHLSNGNVSVVSNIDLDEVMAWQNNQFYFSGNDIKEIMRQVEKYYDVTVEYKDQIPYQFVAKITRDVNVSDFLKRLELTNLVHFKIEGRKIIVSK